MRKRLFILAGCVGLSLPGASSLFGDTVIPAETPAPIFVHLAAGNHKPEGFDIFLDIAEHFNKPYLNALLKRLDAIDQKKRIGDAFGPLFNDRPDQPSRQVHLLEKPPFVWEHLDKETIDAMAAYKSQRTWVLTVRDQFFADGYCFILSAAEVHMGESGPQIIKRFNVFYMEFFSPRVDIIARGIKTTDRNISPRIGSKDARDLYWFSGSPTHFETLFEIAPRQSADLLKTLLRMTATEGTKGFNQELKTKPKLRHLRSQGRAASKGTYSGMHVLDETEDRLLLGSVVSGKGFPNLVSINRWGLD